MHVNLFIWESCGKHIFILKSSAATFNQEWSQITNSCDTVCVLSITEDTYTEVQAEVKLFVYRNSSQKKYKKKYKSVSVCERAPETPPSTVHCVSNSGFDFFIYLKYRALLFFFLFTSDV